MESHARAHAHGPALVHALARIAGIDAPLPPRALSARLAQWIDWPQAVALAAVLDARAAAPGVDPSPGDEGEYAGVRAALVRAIESDRAFSGTAPPPPSGSAGAPPADAAFHRKRYLALQQVMEAEVGHVRGRLRGRLARRGGDAARLAAIDAVMERALGRHERALLAGLPDLVGGQFERLEQAAPGAAVPPWLARFRHDMRQLLLAELDFRLQPAHGLQAALRTLVPAPDAR